MNIGKILVYIIIGTGLPLWLSAGPADGNISIEGTWQESLYAEQTLKLYKDHRCEFLRGGTLLFSKENCRWEMKGSDGKLRLDFHGNRTDIFLKYTKGTLLLARRKINLNRGSADSIMQKPENHGTASGYRVPFVGRWEALDHSYELRFSKDGKCLYSKGDEILFNWNQCHWNAGKEGGTMVFMVDKNTRRNAAVYLKIYGNRMLGATDKRHLAPRSADLNMIREE
jgi:hypothetical protein